MRRGLRIISAVPNRGFFIASLPPKYPFFRCLPRFGSTWKIAPSSPGPKLSPLVALARSDVFQLCSSHNGFSKVKRTFTSPTLTSFAEERLRALFSTQSEQKVADNDISSSDYKRLVGKVAVITGGSSGIGETTVKLFVEHGAKVVIADVQDEKGQTLMSQLGPSTLYTHCDVQSEKSMAATVALAVEKFGKLDIMFNNAGIIGKGLEKDVTELEMAYFDEVMAVNVRGMTLGVKYAGKKMVERGEGGVILCNASVASVLAGLAPPAYTISKHAILGLVRAAASDLGKHGIRVNCVSPFGVKTPLYASMTAGDDSEEARDRTANLQGHSLSALDVARCALFLASDDAAYVSGLNLMVDGGFTVTNHTYQS